MNVQFVTANKVLIYQTYTDTETELVGEPALLVSELTGGMISISSHEGNEVLINYDTIPALMKIFKGFQKGENMGDIKF